MRKLLLMAHLALVSTILSAQNYQISFTGSGESTTVDSVVVKNLDSQATLTILGSDILELNAPVVNLPSETAYGELNVYPNPAKNICIASCFFKSSGEATITIADISGKLISSQTFVVKEGNAEFKISNLTNGFYSINISINNHVFSSKIVSTSDASLANTAITLTQNCKTHVPTHKSATSAISMDYNDGERMKYIGYAAGGNARVITDIPTGNATVNFEFLNCTDADNNKYPVVTIGDQVWMAANLKTAKFNDGTDIENELDNDVWKTLQTAAYCWYENDIAASFNHHGALYNYYAINSENLCPTGWHVPSADEWETLIATIGADMVGDKLRETGGDFWNNTNNENLNATNESGFSALGSGFRYGDSGAFDMRMRSTGFGTSTEANDERYSMYLIFQSNMHQKIDVLKQDGMSVRCVKD